MRKNKNIGVLVTGTTGFLGSNILKSSLARLEVKFIAACRRHDKTPLIFNTEVRLGDLTGHRLTPQSKDRRLPWPRLCQPA